MCELDSAQAKENNRIARLDKAKEAGENALQRLSNECGGDLSKLKVTELRCIIESKTYKILTGSHLKPDLVEKCRGLIST